MINYSLWAVFMLKAQHEFPERFLSHNRSYAPILLGSEMELWLNAWNLFLVLFLITALFLFLWHSPGEGLERSGKGRRQAGKHVTDSRWVFVVIFELLAVSRGISRILQRCKPHSKEAGAQKTCDQHNENVTWGEGNYDFTNKSPRLIG